MERCVGIITEGTAKHVCFRRPSAAAGAEGLLAAAVLIGKGGARWGLRGLAAQKFFCEGVWGVPIVLVTPPRRRQDSPLSPRNLLKLSTTPLRAALSLLPSPRLRESHRTLRLVTRLRPVTPKLTRRQWLLLRGRVDCSRRQVLSPHSCVVRSPLVCRHVAPPFHVRAALLRPAHGGYFLAAAAAAAAEAAFAFAFPAAPLRRRLFHAGAAVSSSSSPWGCSDGPGPPGTRGMSAVIASR